MIIPVTLCRAESDIFQHNTNGESTGLSEERWKQTIPGVSAEKMSEAEKVTGVDGEPESLLVNEGGNAEFAFQVPDDGLYTISVRYYPWKGDGGDLVRSLLIDGTLPFEQAENLVFSRVWNDDGEPKRDLQGNDIRPRQVEIPSWQERAVSDPLGYEENPYLFNLKAGVHTLRLESVEEPWLIGSITISSAKQPLSYSEQLARWESEGARPAGETLYLEAEKAAAKSHRTLYPLNDRSSPYVSPYDSNAVRYNTIGGSQWSMVGQWLEWELDVRESGLYTICLHFRQNVKNDDVSYRRLTIDGAVPFKEAEAVAFRYDSSWQYGRLGEDKVKGGYQFYMEKGTRRLRLEVVLGDYGTILKKMSDILSRLNAVNRSILGVTGPDPDMYRDYQFEKVIPDTLAEIKDLSRELRELEKQVINLTGRGGQSTAALRQLYLLMERINEDCSTIPQRLNNFQNNISNLAAWINSASLQPLEIDTIELRPVSENIKKSQNHLFDYIWHYMRQFFYSFLTDYNAIGQIETGSGEKITVWLDSVGRDQLQIIQQMVNNDFAPGYNISANVKLVTAGSMLPATLAGIGPDVSLQMPQTEPMNYALRNAVYNLTEFDDLPEVLSRFDKSAVEPFAFDGKTYALPETQVYPMLFYRADILKDLGIKVEDLDAWDSVLKVVLPKLQRSYLQFGMLPGLNTFAIMLYQHGGSLYTQDGSRSLLDSMESVEAFSRYVSLYSDYTIPLAFDFANRFRSGEMPIAIADFTAYNQLSVFAPEIRGLWEMRHVPGIVDESGRMNYTVPSTVTGCVIMNNSVHKKAAWTFLKWWTSAEAQISYGDELESIMGTAARYPSANLKARASLNWTATQKKELEFQALWLKAVPQVPGSYYTERNFVFAFRDVVYNNRNQRESLNQAVREINAEIASKRQEFGY